MVQDVHSRSATRPVLFAIVVTMAVCGLCMAAYTKFVIEPKMRTMSADDQSICAERTSPNRAEVQTRQNQDRRRDAVRTAAILRELMESRAPASAAADEEAPENEAYRPSDEALLANRRAEMATLEKALAVEPFDVDWSVETEKITADAVAGLGGKLVLNEVSCRKTFCRARMTHLEPDKRDDDINRLLTTPALSTQVATYIPEDDDRDTILYFAREGHTLSVMRPDNADVPMPPAVVAKQVLPPFAR